MSSAALPIPYSNPLAPQWMLPNFDNPLAELRWRWDATFTVSATTTTAPVEIQLLNDAEVVVESIAWDQGLMSGVRLRDGNGKPLMNSFLDPRDVQGPLPMPWVLPVKSKCYAELQNGTGESITTQIILQGKKRFNVQPQQYPNLPKQTFIPLWKRYSMPPAGWHDEPFIYPIVISLTANQTIYRQFVQMDGDADFYLRGWSQVTSGDGAVAWKFYDYWNQALCQDFVYAANLMGVGNARNPVFEEVPCEARSTVQFDIQEQAGQAVTVYAALEGVKRFKD